MVSATASCIQNMNKSKSNRPSGKDRSETQNYILIGFASIGKTTCGKLLAERLSYSFVDLDEAIVKRFEAETGQKLTCRAIYAGEGEERFAELEQRSLEETVRSGPMVLATGGGAPLRPENRKLLSGAGYIVYLKAKPETIAKRMSAKGAPLSIGAAADLETIRAHCEMRNRIYASMADYIVDSEGLTPEQVVDRILYRPAPGSSTDADAGK